MTSACCGDTGPGAVPWNRAGGLLFSQTSSSAGRRLFLCVGGGTGTPAPLPLGPFSSPFPCLSVPAFGITGYLRVFS